MPRLILEVTLRPDVRENRAEMENLIGNLFLTLMDHDSGAVTSVTLHSSEDMIDDKCRNCHCTPKEG